jgi:hypothetical protein
MLQGPGLHTPKETPSGGSACSDTIHVAAGHCSRSHFDVRLHCQPERLGDQSLAQGLIRGGFILRQPDLRQFANSSMMNSLQQCRTLQNMYGLPAHRKLRVTMYEQECLLVVDKAINAMKSTHLGVQFGAAIVLTFYTGA